MWDVEFMWSWGFEGQIGMGISSPSIKFWIQCYTSFAIIFMVLTMPISTSFGMSLERCIIYVLFFFSCPIWFCNKYLKKTQEWYSCVVIGLWFTYLAPFIYIHLRTYILVCPCPARVGHIDTCCIHTEHLLGQQTCQTCIEHLLGRLKRHLYVW